jgi:hypothetical protein
MCKHEKTALLRGWLPLEGSVLSSTSRGYFECYSIIRKEEFLSRVSLLLYTKYGFSTRVEHHQQTTTNTQGYYPLYVGGILR